MFDIVFKVGAFAAGFFVLVRGADYLVDYSIFIAKRFKLPDGFVGIAILSVGTSLPEFSTCIYALFTLPQQQATSFVVSNVLGSNISNMGMVFSTALLFSRLQIPEVFFKKHLPINLLALVVFFFFSFNAFLTSEASETFYGKLSISRFEGVGLLLIMAVYLFFSYKESATSEKTKTIFPKYFFNWLGVLYFFMALLAIYFGSRWIVDGAFFLAVDLLKIDEKIIVITLVAFGTSLPELATSVATLKKKQYGLFLGNIMGSNMFNILFVVGLSSVLLPLELEASELRGNSVLDFAWFLFFLTLLALCALVQKRFMTKKSSFVMFVGYTLFVLYLLKV